MRHLVFGSLGGQEILLLLVLALLIFGPRKLPRIGRTIGRALAEFRHVSHEFKSGLVREVELEERRERVVPKAAASPVPPTADMPVPPAPEAAETPAPPAEPERTEGHDSV